MSKAFGRKAFAGLRAGLFLLSWIQNCITGTSLGESGKDISFIIFSITSFPFFLSPAAGCQELTALMYVPTNAACDHKIFSPIYKPDAYF